MDTPEAWPDEVVPSAAPSIEAIHRRISPTPGATRYHPGMEHRWDIVSDGTLYAVDREAPAARVYCEIWIIEPREGFPGKWGGRLRVTADLGLSAADFMFRLVLADGREADCFVEMDYGEGTGLIDGNGPPPGVSPHDSTES